MNDEQIRLMAEFYKIDAVEARRRYEVFQAHTGDLDDPICAGCARRAGEVADFDQLMDQEEYERLHQPGQEQALAEARVRYCLEEEGTLNPENGHFLCMRCYIRNGQPTGSGGRRWVCP